MSGCCSTKYSFRLLFFLLSRWKLVGYLSGLLYFLKAPNPTMINGANLSLSQRDPPIGPYPINKPLAPSMRNPWCGLSCAKGSNKRNSSTTDLFPTVSSLWALTVIWAYTISPIVHIKTPFYIFSCRFAIFDIKSNYQVKGYTLFSTLPRVFPHF